MQPAIHQVSSNIIQFVVKIIIFFLVYISYSEYIRSVFEYGFYVKMVSGGITFFNVENLSNIW